MTDKTPLIIRADANSHIGMGHAMRCIALGQRWRNDGGDVYFLTTSRSERLLNKVQNESFKLVSLNEAAYEDSLEAISWLSVSEAKLSLKCCNSWVVLDGYHFDKNYQEAIKGMGCNLIVVDDRAHLPSYSADIILNQNADAVSYKYFAPSSCKLLLGSGYALIRDEFLRLKPRKCSKTKRPLKVLVSLGGADYLRLSARIIAELGTFCRDEIEVRLITGDVSINRLGDYLPGDLSFQLQIVRFAEDYPEMVKWADLAVTAGGSSCWEFAYMGVPTVILTLADNQEGLSGELARRNVAINLGSAENLADGDIASSIKSLYLDTGKMGSFSENGKKLIDGLGAHRVQMEMMNFIMK